MPSAAKPSSMSIDMRSAPPPSSAVLTITTLRSGARRAGDPGLDPGERPTCLKTRRHSPSRARRRVSGRSAPGRSQSPGRASPRSRRSDDPVRAGTNGAQTMMTSLAAAGRRADGSRTISVPSPSLLSDFSGSTRPSTTTATTAASGSPRMPPVSMRNSCSCSNGARCNCTTGSVQRNRRPRCSSSPCTPTIVSGPSCSIGSRPGARGSVGDSARLRTHSSCASRTTRAWARRKRDHRHPAGNGSRSTANSSRAMIKR